MKTPILKPVANEDDATYYEMKAVAVQCQGLLSVAAVAKVKPRKGEEARVFIWLTGEQQGHVLGSVPRKHEWLFCDRTGLCQIERLYPRHALGYCASMCGRRPTGLDSGEDALLDAEKLLKAMDALKSNEPQLTVSIGFRGVERLVRVALGLPIDEKAEAAR